MAVFINLSNHASENQSAKQLAAAQKYGDIVDVRFPIISPTAESADIDRLVSKYIAKLYEYDCAAVMVQGEFVLTYRITAVFKKLGITVLSACSERRTAEHI